MQQITIFSGKEESTENTNISGDVNSNKIEVISLVENFVNIYDYLSPIKDIVSKYQKDNMKYSILYAVLVYFYDAQKYQIPKKEITTFISREVSEGKHKITSLKKSDLLLDSKNYIIKTDDLVYRNKCFEVINIDKQKMVKLNKEYILEKIPLLRNGVKKIYSKKPKEKNLNKDISIKEKENVINLSDELNESDFDLEIDEDYRNYKINDIIMSDNENSPDENILIGKKKNKNEEITVYKDDDEKIAKGNKKNILYIMKYFLKSTRKSFYDKVGDFAVIVNSKYNEFNNNRAIMKYYKKINKLTKDEDEKINTNNIANEKYEKSVILIDEIITNLEKLILEYQNSEGKSTDFLDNWKSELKELLIKELNNTKID